MRGKRGQPTDGSDEAEPPGRRGIQVIERAAAILRTLEDEPEGTSLGRIASRLGLARSTVQRIVDALEAEQLVIRAGPGGGLRLGPAIRRLARSVGDDLVRLAQPHLIGLSRRLDETVDLSVLRAGRVVFVDQIVGKRRLQAVSAVGEAFPLHCTAPGKACLAALPEREAHRLVVGRMERMTPATLTEAGALLDELAEVRRAGVAFDREEHTVGICAVGAAFRDPWGTLAAVSVPVPETRFREAEEALAAGVLDLASALRRLGGGDLAP